MFAKLKKHLRKTFNLRNDPSSLSFDNPAIWNQLKYMNLSNCEITTLPKELGALCHLEKLVLSNNNFGTSDEFNWDWLQPAAIRNNLRFLDLSHNSLTELPKCIGELSALTELIISCNLLTNLPQSIGNLRNLKILRTSNNKLLFLPGSLLNMQLETLDISMNEFATFDKTFNYMQLTLCNLALKVFFKNRSMYGDVANIPSKVFEYLEKTVYCLRCKNPCFESYIMKLVPLSPVLVAVVTIVDNDESKRPSFECYFCSMDCCQMWIEKFLNLNNYLQM